MKPKFKKSNYVQFLIILLLISGSVYSQERIPGKEGNKQGPPPPIPTTEEIYNMTNDLAKELNLTETQKKSISSLYQSHFKEARLKQEKAQKIQEKNKIKMDSIRANFESKISALLLPEQKEKFNTFLKNHKPRHNRKKHKPCDKRE